MSAPDMDTVRKRRHAALIFIKKATNQGEAETVLTRLEADEPDKLERLDAVYSTQMVPLARAFEAVERAERDKVERETAQRRSEHRAAYLADVEKLSSSLDAFEQELAGFKAPLQSILHAAVALQSVSVRAGEMLSCTPASVACRIGEEAARIVHGAPSQLVEDVLRDGRARVARLLEDAPRA